MSDAANKLLWVTVTEGAVPFSAQVWQLVLAPNADQDLVAAALGRDTPPSNLVAQVVQSLSKSQPEQLMEVWELLDTRLRLEVLSASDALPTQVWAAAARCAVTDAEFDAVLAYGKLHPGSCDVEVVWNPHVSSEAARSVLGRAMESLRTAEDLHRPAAVTRTSEILRGLSAHGTGREVLCSTFADVASLDETGLEVACAVASSVFDDKLGTALVTRLVADPPDGSERWVNAAVVLVDRLPKWLPREHRKLFAERTRWWGHPAGLKVVRRLTRRPAVSLVDELLGDLLERLAGDEPVAVTHELRELDDRVPATAWKHANRELFAGVLSSSRVGVSDACEVLEFAERASPKSKHTMSVDHTWLAPLRSEPVFVAAVFALQPSRQMVSAFAERVRAAAFPNMVEVIRDSFEQLADSTQDRGSLREALRLAVGTDGVCFDDVRVSDLLLIHDIVGSVYQRPLAKELARVTAIRPALAVELVDGFPGTLAEFEATLHAAKS